MTCQCEVCKFNAKYKSMLNRIAEEEMREFFKEMLSLITELDMDAAYYKAIVKNEWHCSDEILARYRKKETPLIVTGPVPEFERNFEVGKTYLRADGKKVKIISEREVNMSSYCMVLGDDIGDFPYPDRIWREDGGDAFAGRVIGSSFEMSDPRNLIPGEVEL